MRNLIRWIVLPMSLSSLLAMAQSGNRSDPIRITQGPRIENTTSSEATIAWSTNLASSTVVKYGTDPNQLNQTAQTPWGGLTHRVIIKNLRQNTTYYFIVDSGQAQGSGTSTSSDVQQFQTKSADSSGQKASTPPKQVAAGPVLQDVTTSSATLWWLSDQNAPSEVKYGLSQASLDRTALDRPNANEHVVQLNGLEPGKTYYYSVSKPTGGSAATGHFTTLQQETDSGVKITNGPVIEYVGHNHAIIAWSTSGPASTVVKYGTDPDALDQTAQAPWGSTTHRVDILNLQPNTRYYFEVVSSQTQGSGTLARRATGQFHTMAQGQQALALTER